MTRDAFGTVLGAQALYMTLQILVNAGRGSTERARRRSRT
jgi:hypothetical protein